MRTIYSHGLKKEFGSEFPGGLPIITYQKNTKG